MIQNTQPIREPGNLVNVMGDQKHRDREIPAKGDDFGLQVNPGPPVDGRERFVQQQHLRVPGQGTGNGHALPLAAGQFGGFARF